MRLEKGVVRHDERAHRTRRNDDGVGAQRRHEAHRDLTDRRARRDGAHPECDGFKPDQDAVAGLDQAEANAVKLWQSRPGVGKEYEAKQIYEQTLQTDSPPSERSLAGPNQVKPPILSSCI